MGFIAVFLRVHIIGKPLMTHVAQGIENLSTSSWNRLQWSLEDLAGLKIAKCK